MLLNELQKDFIIVSVFYVYKALLILQNYFCYLLHHTILYDSYV